MNILREFRRVQQKSLPARISLILLFSVMLIISTYAWHRINKDSLISNLEGDVTSWDVSYYIKENEMLSDVAVFTIDEFYPGMPNREDIVNIYNVGESSTNIEYELISVKVFGQEVLPQLIADGEIDTDEDTNTTSLFSKDTAYPFDISYTYDKDYLKNKYVDDQTTPQSHATFKFNVSWSYRDTGDEDDVEARDILDTKFGKDAYAYYNSANSDPSKAVEVRVKITSSRIHPTQEHLYNQGT